MPGYAALFVLLFIVAHIMKFIRFYLVLLEQKRIYFISMIFLYARTTLVNLLIPFKLGEFYRIFAVKRVTGDLPAGILSVVVDRFFDTVALVLIILPFEVLYEGQIGLIPALLSVFLLVLFAIYLFFKPSYLYLNRYLIREKNSIRSITTLRYMDIANSYHETLSTLIIGRSPLIFLSSIFGWVFEFLALKCLASAFAMTFTLREFNEYIDSIFMIGSLPISRIYACLTIILIAIFTCISATLFTIDKRRRFKA